MIDIDLDARTLNVRLNEEEIRSRTAALQEFKPRTTSKWLRRYAQFVTSANTGAVLRS
jgi:dihydroxy-acid dehydratase